MAEDALQSIGVRQRQVLSVAPGGLLSAALADLMNLFHVRMAVIDGAYDATKAKEFSHKFPKHVLRAYYPRRRIRCKPLRRDVSFPAG